MRKTCLDLVYDLAQKDKRIFFIGSDLGFGTLKEFKKNFPERFFMEGTTEANIVGMSAGLAMEGKIVYINTIANFFSRRAFEQIVLDLGLHNVNVRLICNGGGLVYAPLGPTHLAIEDISILRTIPNMTIVAPADAEEMKRFMPLTVNHQGPIYIRLAKGYDPIVSRKDLPFEIGKAILIKKGKDALIVTTGITLKLALDAHTFLMKQGIDVSVLHMHTLKPLDKESIILSSENVPVIVTIEENTIIGGLGSAVAEVIIEENYAVGKRFKRIGIPDVFPNEYGSQASQLESFGITTENLVSVVENLVLDKV